MHIQCGNDLKIAYGLLRIAAKRKELNEFSKELKRNIREYYKRKEEIPEGNINGGYSRMVKDNGIDGFVLLQQLPADLETEKDAVQYFEDYERIEYQPSFYDCTGQLFTSWYKVFKRNDRFYVYHWIARDL